MNYAQSEEPASSCKSFGKNVLNHSVHLSDEVETNRRNGGAVRTQSCRHVFDGASIDRAHSDK